MKRPCLYPLILVSAGIASHAIVGHFKNTAWATGYVDESGEFLPSVARGVTRPDQRRYAVILPTQRLVSSFYISQEAAARSASVRLSGDCEAPTVAPYVKGSGGFIEGYETIRYSRTEGPKANGETVTFSFWRAPALDCTALRELAEWRDRDGRLVASHDKTAIRVIEGEPDPKWFEIPNDLRETAPLAQGVVLGKPATGDQDRALRAQDRKYFALQKHRP